MECQRVLDSLRSEAKRYKEAYLAMREENGILRQQIRNLQATIKES